MTLALDSAVGADKASGLTNWSYTHTLNNAKPKAVLVLVGANFTSDTISACTFGGVALTRLTRCGQSSAGDSAPSYAFFRNGGFDGLASGAQTVAFTESDNTAGVAGSFALFADRGVEVVATQRNDLGTVSNPSAAVVVPPGRPLFIASFLTSGSNTIAATSAAGQSRVKDRDYGSVSGYVDRKTNIAAYTADPTMSWTIGSFSHVILSVALAETIAGPGGGAVNHQNPGVFSVAREAWRRSRSGIIVPKLWTPKEAMA